MNHPVQIVGTTLFLYDIDVNLKNANISRRQRIRQHRLAMREHLKSHPKCDWCGCKLYSHTLVFEEADETVCINCFDQVNNQ